VSCAELRFLGSNASWLLCEEGNRVHRSREPSGENSLGRQRKVLQLRRRLPEATGCQPATGAYASGTPMPFISIFQLRFNSSSNTCLIQSDKVLNVNSSGRSRPSRRGRATTVHQSTSRRSSSKDQDERKANDWILSHRYHLCLAEHTIAGLNRRAFPVEAFNLLRRSISQIARHIATNDRSALATINQ